MNHPQAVVGREAELARIRRLADESRQSGARLLLVSGKGGIGKTALVQMACRTLRNEELFCAAGRWHESSHIPEQWVWRRVIRELTLCLSTTVHAEEIAATVADRVRLIDCVTTLVRKITGNGRLLLILDNLHRASEVSLDLVLWLLSQLHEASLLILATYRPVTGHAQPLSRFLGEVLRWSTTEEMTLRPLSESETAQLVRRILGHSVNSDVQERIVAQAQGNPLFAVTVARLARRQVEMGEFDTSAFWQVGVPSALGVALSRHIAELCKESVAVLSAASLVGESFTIDELRLALFESEQSDLDDGLSHGIGAGFLDRSDSEGRLHFSHPLVHATFQTLLTPSKREQRYRRLAFAIERVHADNLEPWALRLAHWWANVNGEDARSKRLHYTTIASASALESGAWGEAISLWEGLATQCNRPPANDDDARTLFGWGASLYRSGDRSKAVTILRELFAYYREQQNVGAMMSVIELPGYLEVGEPSNVELIRGMLDFVVPESPEETRLLYLYAVGLVNVHGDYERAQDLLTRAYERAKLHANALIMMRVLVVRALISAVGNDLAGAASILERAARYAEREPDAFTEAHIHGGKGAILIAQGRRDEAIPCLDRALDIALSLRDHHVAANLWFVRSRAAVLYGCWNEARRYGDMGLRRHPNEVMLLAHRAALEYAQGNFAAGDSFRKRLITLHERTLPGPYLVHLHVASTAVIRGYFGRWSVELHRWQGYLETMLSNEAVHPFIALRAHLLLMWVAYMESNPRLARDHYRAVEALPKRRLMRPYLQERLMGLAAHCMNDRNRAMRHFETALEHAKVYGDRAIRGWILYELYQLLQSSGTEETPPRVAVQYLLEASSIAESLSMAPLADRVQPLLEQLQHGASSRQPGYLHLTEREREILSLVAVGMSNGEIAASLGISNRTVGNHLRSILEHTGTRSRTEAVAFVRRVGAFE